MVDCGATHNFIPLSMAKRWGLPVSGRTITFGIQLGNGNKIACLGTVDVTIQILNMVQQLCFVVMPSSEEKLILGMPWLNRSMLILSGQLILSLYLMNPSYD